jgi:hypothetical protein
MPKLPKRFNTRIGTCVTQTRLAERFGRTASWVSRQGRSVVGHVFSPSSENWTGEIWHRQAFGRGVKYQRIA